jgi:biopolymer transport protein ExbB
VAPDDLGPTSTGDALPVDGIAADAQGGVATLPRDLSPWGMFASADRIVQGVMIGLVLASVMTWSIAIKKGFEVSSASARTRSNLNGLRNARSLAEAAQSLRGTRGAAAELVDEALREYALSDDLVAEGLADGIKERIAARLARAEAAAGRRAARATGLLATIGATAPFVGLFGTVWGIMNAFVGISQAQTTNLAIVAPGIAEALLATALGLVTAIPAVVIYNAFARAIAAYRALLSDASAEVLSLASRDLDRELVPSARAQAAE